MHRFYVKIARSNGEWTCATVVARNEQQAVWSAFDKLGLLSADGWVASDVSLLTENWC